MLKQVKIFDSKDALLEKVPAGTIVELHLENNKIAITQTKTGFYAFKNECPHNRVALSDGKCNVFDEIVCPWHNYRFDLKTGDETSSHGYNLKIYRIDFRDDGVYLNL